MIDSAMARACRICCSTVTILISICMVVLGVVLIGFFEHMIRNQIVDNVVLKNGTDSFKAWQDPPVPVHMQFWVFDLVNPEEVMINGSKPVLKQKGPYTYREIRPKGHVVFNDNGTLTYAQNKTFMFVREMSVGPQTDTVTSINLLYATIAEKFLYSSSWTKGVVNAGLEMTKQRLFANYTIHDLIWGYRITALKDLADIIHFFDPNVNIPYDIGLFADVNGTNDGKYTIFTGSRGVHSLNVIDKWKGQSELNWWTTDTCNRINGTDGTGYHPFIDREDILYIFSSDICRSIYVTYNNDVSVQGIPLYRFTPPSEVFANVTTNPANRGFCTPDCLHAGVLNISVCKEGAPVVVSQPHLYQAAPEYINAVIGLDPNGGEHTTVLDLEPHTGMVLNAAKRLQINIYVRQSSHFTDMNALPPLLIYPVAWINESAALDAKNANKLKSQLLTPILITKIVQYGLIALGGVLLILTIIISVVYALTNRQESTPSTVTIVDENGQIQYDTVPGQDPDVQS